MLDCLVWSDFGCREKSENGTWGDAQVEEKATGGKGVKKGEGGQAFPYRFVKESDISIFLIN